MNILKQVTLDRYSRKKDNSVSVTFITATEQTSQEVMDIDNCRDHQGILYFKPSGQLSDKEIKELDATEVEVTGKTKSQRLRAVLAVYCKQQGLDINSFYATEMERIIEHYKEKLT